MTVIDAAATAADRPVPAGDTGRLSNHLTHLAHEAGQAWRRHKAATVEAAEAYLDAGRHLAAARPECPHGRWQEVLVMAGIPARTAQRMIRLAASGMTADDVARSGGVKAALEAIATPKSDTVSHLALGAAAGDLIVQAPPTPIINGTALPPDTAAAMNAGDRKSDTVSLLTEGEAAPETAGPDTRRARRAHRRSLGLCSECGARSADAALCGTCADARNVRRRRRRVLAGFGEAITREGLLDGLDHASLPTLRERLGAIRDLAQARGLADGETGGGSTSPTRTEAPAPEDGS